MNHFFAPETTYVIQGNVRLGKCDSGNFPTGKCLLEELSVWETVRRGKVLQGKVRWVNVSWETVRTPFGEIMLSVMFSFLILRNILT